MLPNYTDYVFTTIPTNLRNCIKGGKFGETMAMTHEEWLWLNEAIRSVEYLGSYTFNPTYCTPTAPTTKDNVAQMAANHTKLKDWIDRADAVTTRRKPDWNTILREDRIWYSSSATESSDNVNWPGLTTEEIDAHITRRNGDKFASPDGLAPSRSKLKTWMADQQLKKYIDASISTGFFTPYSFASSQNRHAGFSAFFLNQNAKWQCNGSDDTNPENSNKLATIPFFYDRPTPFEYHKATTYFKEYSDKGSFAFSREETLGYDFPGIPWKSYGQYRSGDAYKDDTNAQFYFIWAFLSAPLWKNTRGIYSIDAKRNWALFFDTASYTSYGNDSTYWGILNRTIKSAAEQELQRAGYDPSRNPTNPTGSTSTSGWNVVGYQLYIYPAGVIARGEQPKRYIGQEN